MLATSSRIQIGLRSPLDAESATTLNGGTTPIEPLACEAKAGGRGLAVLTFTRGVAENQRSYKKDYIDLATQVFFNSPNTAVEVFLMNPIHFIIFSQFEYFL